MASIGKKGGGDFVLESRHLVGLFLLLVVIFGVVFTLGYLMGRSQYDSRLRAAVDTPVAAAPPVVSKLSRVTEAEKPSAVVPSGSDWEFFHSAEPKTTEDHLQPPKKTLVATEPVGAKPERAPAKPEAKLEAKTVPPLNAPLIPS